MNKPNEVSGYLENIILLLFGLLLLSVPLVFATVTTDAFAVPKQAVLIAIVLLSLILFGSKVIADGKVRLRRTPFDLPLWLFLFAALGSAIFSQNRTDALIAYVSLLLPIVSFFLFVNVVKDKGSLFFLTASLVTGAAIAAAISSFAFFTIYLFPYEATRVQTFTTFGSLLDQAVYLLLVLPLAFSIGQSLFDKEKSYNTTHAASFLTGSIIITIGLCITIYQLIYKQPPIILPFETGFQTAFAAISQDTGRVLQGFLLGSGYGTYVTDFTRFKQATFNLHPTLWSFTFLRSSSFLLELLATTGVLGLGTFLFLILRAAKTLKENRGEIAFFSLLFALLILFVLPLSFVSLSLFFFLLSIFAARQGLHNKKDYPDIELQFVALRDSFLPLASYMVSSGENTHQQSQQEKTYTKVLPVFFFVVILALTSTIGFFAVRYAFADVIFQNSLIAAENNNSLQIYNDQVNAIRIFPWRDGFYRIYSQTNLAIANALATTLANQQKTGSAQQNIQETQATIYTLIQQSINAARSATTLSPQTSLNWQNLAGIYRSLIGFGQNAENFSIVTMQQAIALDPNNPQLFLNLGGMYYQLTQWENAQSQFQIAIRLKPDFANAYYNLGHTLESKGDVQNALAQYQTVKTLVANDKPNLDKITGEIQTLEEKIGSAQKTSEETKQELTQQSREAEPSSAGQPPLGINQPKEQLPEQEPPVAIPAPQTTIAPTTTPEATPTR